MTIIIPTLNADKYINQCLLSLMKLDYPKDKIEIIVVDNGSVDNTLELIKRYKVREFILPKVTISALRNYGAKFAKGEVIAFLDADCTVEKNWMVNAIESFTKDSIAAVGCAYKIPSSASLLAKAWGICEMDTVNNSFVKFIPSGNFIVRKECFDKVNGFNEKLRVSEDADICYRLRQMKYKIFSSDSIVAFHFGAAQDLKGFFRKELWHGKDVFKVFLQSGIKMQYLNVVIYAFFYIFMLLSVLVSLVFLNIKVMLFSVLLLILAPLLLTLKIIFTKSGKRYMLQMWELYLVYGIARAMCILDIRNWLFKLDYSLWSCHRVKGKV
ncbi:MAG: glycosyltransferase [Spirochaetes bacterium]|nr:glycosyltransferase [Spirochaetota bacterium]